MRYVAEYVGKGHPDRLADTIVASIVDYVIAKDKDALCGLECAVHTNKVFIDGRIAAGKDHPVINNTDIEDIVRGVYKNARYDKDNGWCPYESDLIIIQDLCIEPLSNEEREIRNFSDDQNIVTGYAINNKESNYLPIAQFVSNIVGRSIEQYIVNHHLEKIYGTDYKLLVDIEDKNSTYSFNKITMSIRHKDNLSFKNIFNDISEMLISILESEFSNTFPSLSKISKDKISLNGAGDFVIGGPEGDNGLSGKKLVIDFYGPDIPIGGGAIFGKDPHKVDVCGALRARKVAIKLIEKYNFYSVLIRLSWSPGQDAPSSIEAYEIDRFGTQTKINNTLLPPTNYFSIKRINEGMRLDTYKWEELVNKGIM